MPNSSVQRRYPRHPLVLSILYKSKEPAPAKVGVGWTRDVSDGGACLELAEPLPFATPLSVILQTDQGSLGVEGKVVWVGGPVAGGGGVLHGVAFRDATPEQLRALWALIARKGQARQAAVRVPVKLAVLCRPKGDAGPPLQGETGDVSREGLSVYLPQLLPAATPIEITLPTRRDPLTLEARVVWVESPEARTPGQPIRHGLRFTNLSWAHELTLGLLLAEVPAEAAPKKGGRPPGQ